MILYCATTNPGKISEFREFASDSITVQPLSGIERFGVCEETGSTFEENAIQKALFYSRDVGGWLFAEDSGLEVDALGREPGVYSARYAGPNATDDANNRLVLQKLGSHHLRSARFVCVIALAFNGKLTKTFHGEVTGEIGMEPRGEHGFGYDSIFLYPPFGCTFGEISRKQKQTVSHRSEALNLLFKYLKF